MKKRKCMCGCGKETNIVNHTNNKSRRIKGEHSKFISGHNLLTKENKEKAIVGTKAIYSQLGFNTLIIWENELKNIDEVLEKIKRFDEL